jgi:hypothetical protein
VDVLEGPDEKDTKELNHQLFTKEAKNGLLQVCRTTD